MTGPSLAGSGTHWAGRLCQWLLASGWASESRGRVLHPIHSSGGWLEKGQLHATRGSGFPKFTPCFHFGMPETAKKGIQKIPYKIRANISPLAKIEPCRPDRSDEIRGHSSLFFAYQNFKIVFSIANRAPLCVVFEESWGRICVDLFWGFQVVGVLVHCQSLGHSGPFRNRSDWRGGFQLRSMYFSSPTIFTFSHNCRFFARSHLIFFTKVSGL